MMRNVGMAANELLHPVTHTVTTNPPDGNEAPANGDKTMANRPFTIVITHSGNPGLGEIRLGADTLPKAMRVMQFASFTYGDICTITDNAADTSQQFRRIEADIALELDNDCIWEPVIAPAPAGNTGTAAQASTSHGIRIVDARNNTRLDGDSAALASAAAAEELGGISIADAARAYEAQWERRENDQPQAEPGTPDYVFAIAYVKACNAAEVAFRGGLFVPGPRRWLRLEAA